MARRRVLRIPVAKPIAFAPTPSVIRHVIATATRRGTPTRFLPSIDLARIARAGRHERALVARRTDHGDSRPAPGKAHIAQD